MVKVYILMKSDVFAMKISNVLYVVDEKATNLDRVNLHPAFCKLPVKLNVLRKK